MKQNSMARPKVLFVVEKWAECNPEHPLSNSHHLYIGSLEAAGFAEVDTFFFDEVCWQSGEKCDAALINKCRDSKLDLIYMTMVQGTDLNPLPETLAFIRNELSIPIAASYGDTYSPASIEWIERYTPAITRNVILDNYSCYRQHASEPTLYMDGWTPQHPDYFYGSDAGRPIGISFIGSVSQYPSRKLAISMLMEGDVDITVRGGQLDDHLSIEDYAGFLRASRISLNFPQAAFSEDLLHCKGRVMEITLCGALLVEQENPETRRWFEPGIDYLDYRHEKDLIDKVRYYLAHEEERAAIARVGHQKAIENYTAEAFWRRLFAEFGLSTANTL